MSAFVLVHSPLVGPRTWMDVADCLLAKGHDVLVPSLLGCASATEVVARVSGLGEPDAALVGHSGACPLLPAIGGAAYVFVDGSLPPESGKIELVPEWLLAHLDALTVDGQVPPWSQWWQEGAMEALLPDERIRAEVEAELPSLPRSYFDEHLAVPDGWSREARLGYVQLSEVCEPDAEEARARGWPVEAFEAAHLHMLVAPAEVADAIERVID